MQIEGPTEDPEAAMEYVKDLSIATAEVRRMNTASDMSVAMSVVDPNDHQIEINNGTIPIHHNATEEARIEVATIVPDTSDAPVPNDAGLVRIRSSFSPINGATHSESTPILPRLSDIHEAIEGAEETDNAIAPMPAQAMPDRSMSTARLQRAPSKVSTLPTRRSMQATPSRLGLRSTPSVSRLPVLARVASRREIDSTCASTFDKIFEKKFGVTEEELKRFTALKKMGVSEADLKAASTLFAQAAISSEPAKKTEKLMGMSDDQMKRAKAMKMLNTSEEEFEVWRQQQLGQLGSGIMVGDSYPAMQQRTPSSRRAKLFNSIF